MTLQVVVVTRNRSMYVKTLHTLLAIQGICGHYNLAIGLNFIIDANKEKMELLKTLLKTGDRLVWFEYGCAIEKDGVQHMVSVYEKFDGIVFPVVKEGIDWAKFREKTLADSAEPVHQRALTFDTTVTNKVFDSTRDYYPISSTDPHVWSIDTKSVTKKLKDKKNGFVLPPTITKFFENCTKRGVKLMAATGVDTFNHFTHECVGNLMNIPGLKVTME